MEMKELCKTLLVIYEAKDIGELSQKILDAMLSGQTDVYSKYLSLCPDVEVDYIRAIWEYYEADRDENKQDYTPACLGELVSDVIGDDGGVVYDCCAGSGSLSIQRWIKNKTATFICEELDRRIIPFLVFNLAVRNIGGYVVHGNALEQKRFRVFELTPSGDYSVVKEVPEVKISADYGVSNPPYNIPWNPPSGDGLFAADDRFAELGTPSKNNANYAFVVHVLSKIAKRAAFILPSSVFNADNDIRKAIIDKGLLQAVVMLPGNLFINTSIATCILVFDKTANNNEVVFIDARELHGIEVRRQRGEGHVHYHRVYSKNIRVLLPEHIEKILGCIAQKGRSIDLYATIYTKQIKEQDYDITPSRYIEYTERREPNRPLLDIVKDINRCRLDKNMTKITINKTTAKLLGMDALAELLQKNNEITDAMNGMAAFKNMGAVFSREDYVSLSDHNEIRIEKNNKEDLSHLVLLFLHEFKNHIYYLNERENEYLAELRDAMLPSLMNGDIPVSEGTA